MLAEAPPFSAVAERIFSVVEKYHVVAAHHLSYDREMLDLEARRLGREIKWPRRCICTVEQTVHLRGFYLDLTSLHEHLLGSKFEGAHRAEGDVGALVRCLVEMRRRGEI